MRPESLSQLVALLRDGYYANMLSDMERAKRLYNHEFGGLFKDAGYQYDVPIHESSTASNIVDSFRNQFRTDEPTVQFTPAGVSRDALAEAHLMEMWGRGQIRKAVEMSEVDPFMQAMFDGLLPGALCIKSVVDVNRVPPPPPGKNKTSVSYREWQAHVAGAWPYLVRAIDPMTVFPAPGSGKNPPWVLEVHTRMAADMWASYPMWGDPRGQKLSVEERLNPARRVEWAEFWSAPVFDHDGKMVEPGYYWAQADGETIVDKDNPYGVPPYIYSFSGMGRRDAEGDPRHLAVGILKAYQGELEDEVRIKSALSADAQAQVFGTLIVYEDPNVVKTDFTVGPARIIKALQPGMEPHFMERKQPNENLLKLLDRVDDNISRLRNISLLGGREPGVRYGVQQAMMIGQALKAMNPLMSTMDSVGSRVVNLMARQARVQDIAMTVEGTMEEAEKPRLVRGSDFKHENFKVTWEVTDPAENDRLLMSGEMLRGRGGISRRTMWSKFAKHVVDDPDEEEAELLYQDIMQWVTQSGLLAQLVFDDELWAKFQKNPAPVLDEKRRALVDLPADVGREVEAIAGTPGSTVPGRGAAQEGAVLAGRS